MKTQTEQVPLLIWRTSKALAGGRQAAVNQRHAGRQAGSWWVCSLTLGPQSRVQPSLMGISTTSTLGASVKYDRAKSASCTAAVPGHTY